MGIHGICHSAYVVEENVAAKELHLTQNIDIKNCHQKAEIYQGMALAHESKNSKEVCMLYYLKVQEVNITVLFIRNTKHILHFREVKMWLLL